MNETTQQSLSKSSPSLLAIVEKALGKGSPMCTAFSDLMARGENGGLDDLLDDVDESDYSLADWVEALIAFDGWLAEKGETRRPLAAMRSYIHCCTYLNSPQLCLPVLKVIVIKALTEFGFVAVSEPQI